MILTHEEIAFLDAYCHEGSEPPFGGPATDAMTHIPQPAMGVLARSATNRADYRQNQRRGSAASVARS